MAQSLGKIGKDNPVALSALVELIRKPGNEDTRRLVAESLGHIDEDNPVATAALVELINTYQDESTRRLAAYIAVLTKVRYAQCPMPNAQCPMPNAQSYLIFLRKAIA